MLEENTNPIFLEAEQSWDLVRLYKDLANIKGKHLSPMEKIYLRGLLLGKSPAKLAEALNKSAEGLEVDLSKTLYQYIKDLLDRNDEKIKNWREIRDWLEEVGYKKSHLALNSLQIIGTIVDISKVTIEKVHIERIKSENSTIAIDISIRLTSISEPKK